MTLVTDEVRGNIRRAATLAAIVTVGLVGTPASTPIARAADAAAGRVDIPSHGEVEKTLPEGRALTGHEIYDRLFKNRKRLRTVVQSGRILSKDPAGNPQEIRFQLKAKDYRDADDRAVDGVHSKMLIVLTGPRDLERTGYLYVHRTDRADDQFIYSPMRKRSARANIRGQTVAGTDFSFDDFLAALDDLEEATYRRQPDEVVDGSPCYVVEAVMKPGSRSHYSRSVAAIEKDHYVPLRIRYWDDAGVEIKELRSPRTSIRAFGDVWVPTESTMTDLLENTQSTMTIDELSANPDVPDNDLMTSALERLP